MTKIEKIEKELEKVNELANAVAKEANKELAIARYKITCLTVLVALICVIEAVVAIFSVIKVTDLFYDMEIEEEIVYENDVEQNTGDGSGSNYYITESDNNNVGI